MDIVKNRRHNLAGSSRASIANYEKRLVILGTILVLITLAFVCPSLEAIQNQNTEENSKPRVRREASKNKFSSLNYPPTTSNQGHTNEAPVDSILKETMASLDLLDFRLSEMTNKTPGALMRDSLRALIVRNPIIDESSAPPPPPAVANLEPDDESLLRFAESFSSDRKSVIHQVEDHLLAAEDSNTPQVKHLDPSLLASVLGDEDMDDVPIDIDIESQPNRKASARQLMNSEDLQTPQSDSTDRHIKFTLDLMQGIFGSQSYSAKSNSLESFLISPLSIQMVLMLMHLGARGQTRREIGQCLHLLPPAKSLEFNKPISSNKNASSIALPELLDSTQSPGRVASAGNFIKAKLKRRNPILSSGNSSAQSKQESTSNSSQKVQRQTGSGVTSTVNVHEQFSNFLKNLLKDPSVSKALTCANQIFLQRNLPLSSQYEWAIKQYYSTDVRPVDFQYQPPAVANQSSNNKDTTQDSEQTDVQRLINDWIERQTRGKISNFLTSPVPTSTLMMAINVLHFKGDWQYKFDPADTESDAWFTLADGKTVRLPMMVSLLPLAFAHDNQLKVSVIELPYKAQRLGLFLLLPDDTNGIFNLVQQLNSTNFANLISSMRKQSPNVATSGGDLQANAFKGVNVRIPKFGIESSPRISQILTQQLGLKTLFSPDQADLSSIFSQRKSNGTSGSSQVGGLMAKQQQQQQQQPPVQVGLDELLHKAVLQIDEQGSVAAATSATVVERVGPLNGNYFEADHPFLIFLMDKQTGLVLFSGVFAGPNQAPGSSRTAEKQQQQVEKSSSS